MDVAKPRIDELISETKNVLTETSTRLATVNVWNEDLDGIDLSAYTLHLFPNVSRMVLLTIMFNVTATRLRGSGCSTFCLGEPVKIQWRAPS